MSVSSSESEEAQARKRRAAAAADRRNKVMAQMSKLQTKFAKENAADLEQMETDETEAQQQAEKAREAASGEQRQLHKRFKILN